MIFPYADEAPREGRLPWMNWALIAINCYLYFTLATHRNYAITVYEYGFIPVEFRTVTLFTSMFLHGDLGHLFGNMWFLHLFGDNIENRVGSFKYLIAYLICGVAGSVSHYLFFSTSVVPSIGASGAIFGVMGMYIFFFPNNRIKLFYFFLIILGTTAVRAIWVIGIYFLFELFSSRASVVNDMSSGVAHLAHSGGFVAGLAIAAAYKSLGWIPPDKQHAWSFLTPGHDPDTQPTSADFAGLRATDVARLAQEDPRYAIVSLLHARRTNDAIDQWERHGLLDASFVLPVAEQLQIARALAEVGETGAAADAYERLLQYYPDDTEYRPKAAHELANLLLQRYRRSPDPRLGQRIEQLLAYAAETHPSAPMREQAKLWLAAFRRGG